LSPSREGSPQGSASKGRQSQLVKVFAEFDLDDSGEIESKELLALGQARRSLGQKGGVWDESKNAKLVKNMDSSGDGLVDEKEFARYFDSKLPADAEEFSAIMEQFMEVARACRIKKVEQRKASGGSSSGTRGQGGSVSKRSSDFEKLEADMLVEADQNRSGNNSAGGSSSSSAKAKSEGAGNRQAELRKVYQEFDLDGGGDVGDEELLVLGQTRRKLGQKSGEWTKAMNTALMAKIGVEANGSITADNFVKFFDSSLAKDSADFSKTIEQFMECARACRKTKIAKREASKSATTPKAAGARTTSASGSSAARTQTAQAESSPKTKSYRENNLRKVYQEFDLDGGGDVGDDELLLLGQTRRKLGQKSGSWTKAMNDSLMAKIGVDKNGSIPENNFVNYFHETLASDKPEFIRTIDQFMECAKACRKTKIKKREAAKNETSKEDAAKKKREADAKNADDERMRKEAQQAKRDQEKRESAAESKKRDADRDSKLLEEVESRKRESEQNQDYRQGELRKVYQEFDLDGGGDVGKEELLVLGQTRRKLGQKEGKWTDGMNDTLMKKIGMDRKGSIPENNFVQYFDGTLAGSRPEFDKTVVQFMECARACRKTKVAKREASKNNDAADDAARRKAAAAEEARRSSDAAADEARKAQKAREEQRRQAAHSSTAACENVLTGHTDYALSCVFSHDGNTLVSCGRDHDVRVWNPSTGRCIKVLKGHTQSVYCCDISPDGLTIASGGHDRVLYLWDVEAGRIKHHLFGHRKPVRACKFSFNGEMLVSASYDSTVRLWDTYLGTEIAAMNGHTMMVRCCDFSFNGELVASGGDDATLRVWQAPRGQAVKTISDHTGAVLGCAFSPDGNLLASASEDNTVRMYQVNSWNSLQVFEGHTSHVFSCTFAPDSLTIATSGDDLAVRVWDVASGKCVAELKGHSDSVFCSSFTFATTRKMLATASHDKTIRVWNLGTAEEELVALVCQPCEGVRSPLDHKCNVGANCPICYPSGSASPRSTSPRNSPVLSSARARQSSGGSAGASSVTGSSSGGSARVSSVTGSSSGSARASSVSTRVEVQAARSKSPEKDQAAEDAKWAAREARMKAKAAEASTGGRDKAAEDAKWAAREARMKAKANEQSSTTVSSSASYKVHAAEQSSTTVSSSASYKVHATEQSSTTVSSSVSARATTAESSSRASTVRASNAASPTRHSPKVKLDRNTSRRYAALRKVFRAFDLDRGGYVEAAELMVLGKARRKLGQKNGEWNEEKNKKLISKIDVNGDGQISEDEFVEFFSKALPQTSLEFEAVVSQFQQVADSVSLKF